MKKMKMLVKAIVRISFAIIIIAVGLWCGNMAVHWSAWCPNNDMGFILVIMMYLVAGIFIFYGIYLISPKYIGAIGNVLVDKVLERVVINDEHEDEEEDIW